ncbi:MAG: hypothetical protein Q9209_000002 [Squamulea sp. 1 TL-2023]
MHYSTILSVALVTFTFTPSIFAHAIPDPVALAPAPRAEKPEPIPFPFDESQAAYLEDAFETFENIPDKVIDDGPEAIKQWVLAHDSTGQLAVRSTLVVRQGWVQVAKCALAIGKAIAENALPISKLRRIKELIKVLGGAKEVAKMLLKAKSIKQLIIIGGPELQEIAEILLGLTDVVNDCFSF